MGLSILNTSGGGGASENTAVTFKSLVLASPDANTAFLSATGASLTGSNAQSLIDLAGTWNTSGVPTAIKLNITNTSSGAGSLLMDLKVGGASKFSVNKDGGVSAETYGFATSAMSFLFGTDFSVRSSSDYVLGVTPAGKMQARSGFGINWVSDATNYFSGAIDLSLNRAAAATLQIGDNHATSPVAQTFKGPNATSGNSNGGNLTIQGGDPSGSGTRGSVVLHGGNRAAYDASPSSATIRDILISHGLMAAS